MDLDDALLWILSNNFTSVALQLPDNLLSQAKSICQRIHVTNNNIKTYVLADTSYSSCCVDEIAAAHVDAQCIVHFGEACFSKPPGRIPVYYVLPECDINLRNKLFEGICYDGSSRERLDKSDAVVVFAELAYCSFVCLVADAMSSAFRVSKAIFVNPTSSTESSVLPDVVPAVNSEAIGTTITMFGRRFILPTDCDVSRCSFVFIGAEKAPLLTLFMLSFPQCNFFHLEVKTRVLSQIDRNIHRTLRQRLFLIEKIRDVKTIGILMGTLGVADYLGILSRCQQLIKQTGKKCYVFSLGKLTVAKLANFPEVDVFVHITCPFNLLLNSETSEFYQHIVSPFELEVACNPAVQWHADGPYLADFRALLLHDNPSQDQAGPDVSLITGRVRCQSGEKSRDDDATAVAKQSMDIQPYSAAEYFSSQRTWHGLEKRVEGQAAAELKQGRSGIAAAYEDERTAL